MDSFTHSLFKLCVCCMHSNTYVHRQRPILRGSTREVTLVLPSCQWVHYRAAHQVTPGLLCFTHLQMALRVTVCLERERGTLGKVGQLCFAQFATFSPGVYCKVTDRQEEFLRELKGIHFHYNHAQFFHSTVASGEAGFGSFWRNTKTCAPCLPKHRFGDEYKLWG